tara:strand:+ start:2371 stop:3033 length:663 start_codon:yes stop_codon:yes gene_type:complete
MSTNGLYAAQRVQEIQQIMPTFAKHLEKGDQFLMGIKDDKYFPATYRSSRPLMQMVRKVSTGNGGYDVIAKNMQTQKLSRIPANSVDPRFLWEYTKPTYENILARNDARYRSSRNVTSVVARQEGHGGDAMQEAVNQMGRRVESNLTEKYRSSLQEQQGFKRAIVEALGNMAQEVSSMGPAPFSSLLSDSYRSARASTAVAPRLTSAIENYDSPDELGGW